MSGYKGQMAPYPRISFCMHLHLSRTHISNLFSKSFYIPTMHLSPDENMPLHSIYVQIILSVQSHGKFHSLIILNTLSSVKEYTIFLDLKEEKVFVGFLWLIRL